ncbi:hypothetical protein SOV_24800 [Sporomusa ovata DSM 2662]|uniref:Uncharacterized protein n=1 Tax=Sporomusa ovata TaxID=2378 RepID=A0A0U1L644_9FIRM|nr:hypothetical protein [Sporomusa ovata]EQB25793.1 hypothetical protein SOV_4c04590 [Sporomusa ovata DSM 2662]CQR74354.1 hypothetical protein SpAn4DRAFT_0816 [Sporomusa ovata]
MVMVYTPGNKFECVELKQVQFKLLIDETGQQYLLMYDFGQQYLYGVQYRKRNQPDFTYIDEVIHIEEEPLRKSRFQKLSRTNLI